MQQSAQPDLFSLTSKSILITGGLGFLGKHFVRTLAAQGASVHIIDIVENTSAIKLIQQSQLAEYSQSIVYHQADITNKSSLEFVRDIITASNGLDVLINNAALNPKLEKGNQATSAQHRFEDLPLEDWNREIAVNLTGSMLCCQVFGPVLRKPGSIVNISSIYGLLAPDQSIYPPGFYKPVTYGVTKAGLMNLTKYLASYWRAEQIRVNSIVLGGVENGQAPDFLEKYAKKTLVGRMAQPTDFDGLLVYLCSAASEYSTGCEYIVDGGWSAI